MGRKIAIVGAGAVGGYAGAHMVQAGEDVTFIDPWPDHVEHMRKHGLRVTHAMKEPEFTVPVRDTAMQTCDAQRFKDAGRTAAGQRPSMGQDMQKGRRTEIEFLNGFVVREGEKAGLPCRANAVLTDIVKRVEKGELKADPRHITELRLN
jgi:ketopantoate reductase